MSLPGPRVLAVVALSAALSTGCGAPQSSSPAAPSRSAPEADASPSSHQTSAAPGQTRVTKLLVFVVENHSLDQMREQMPWTFSLSERYGYATAYTAHTHPSLPNYLIMLGGSTFGVRDDLPPAAHPVTGRSVFGQALARGRSARLYAEGMPAMCAPDDDGGRYAVRHNPWTYFVDEQDACGVYDVPLDSFAEDAAGGSLPNAGMVIPDVCHDGHDCDLSVTDDWMRTQVGEAMSGPDWAAGRLAIVVTADEDDGMSGNAVLTTIAYPSLDGVVVDTPLTHYSLTRLYDEVLGAPLLRGAASAPSMAEAFGLPVRGPRPQAAMGG